MASSSAARALAHCLAVELRHSHTKGRFLVAAQHIEPGRVLWQEQPAITCATAIGIDAAAAVAADSTAAVAVPAASPEERVWSHLHSSLSAHVSPSDLLLTMHALRRLRLFGRRSRCWNLIEQLQHSGEADLDQLASAAPAAPSPFAIRFQRIESVAQIICAQLQREIAAGSTGSAAVLPVDPSVAVVVDAALIARILGILQLNAHRCAPLPNPVALSTIAAAAMCGHHAPSIVSSSAAAIAVPAAAPGKGLSLQLSMLEHNCEPNVEFSSQWIPHADLPPHLRRSHDIDAQSGTGLCDDDELLESVGITGSVVLCASSARSSTHTLVLTLRTLRSVSAGEPLSISYYPCRVRTVMRQTHLRNHYGFTCHCARCEGTDETRTFHCCYPALDAANADRPSGGSVSVDQPPQRCSGVMAPLGLGQSAASFRCALCHRALRTEEQYRAVCEWEQRMRGAQGGVAVATAVAARDAAHPSDSDGSGVFFLLYPHPSHYLYPRSVPASAAAQPH